MKIAKIGVLFLSMTVLMTSVFLTEQAFAGDPTCADCKRAFDACPSGPDGDQCRITWQDCIDRVCKAVGGDMIQMETTSILAAGAQYTMAWMIPTLIAAAGIGIVIARKI